MSTRIFNEVRALVAPWTEIFTMMFSVPQRFLIYFRRWRTLFLLAALIVFVFWHFLSSLRNGRLAPDSLTSSEDLGYADVRVSHPPEIEKNTLERLLKDAAMKDKTVILTTLNEAWAVPDSVFDLFLGSFENSEETRRLLKHLVIVCLDQTAQSRCMDVHSHCFDFTTEFDFSEEARFNTREYLNMMWKRLDFLRSVLEMGYNFLFTDADIMWFRDPFSHFYPDADFQIASDVFKGNSDDKRNLPNGGFKFVRSNNRTIQFYKFWYASRERYPGFHDQDVLNKIKFDPKITEIGLTMKFLDTTYFGGFCEVSKDLNKVCTMHANCCVGLESKLHDLRLLLEDWNSYLSMQKRWEPNGSSPWRVPQKCTVPSVHSHVLKRSASRHDTL